MARTPRGATLALLAALLFGLVAVAAKALEAPALAASGAATLVGGLALAPALRGLRVDRSDARRVAAISLLGGLAAPWALFQGVAMTTAVDASLLLTLEMVLTAALAAIFLHERHRPPVLVGLGLLMAAALLVALAAPGATGERRSVVGDLLVVGAALAWSIDSTVSASLATRYRPTQLVALKSLLGGGAAVVLAFLSGGLAAPAPRDAAIVLAVGLLGVAAATVAFYHALRELGATRAVGLFVPASALAGALAGRALHGEPLGWAHLAAVVLVAAGAALASRGE